MRFSGPIDDRILIRKLYSRYADAGSRGAGQDWFDETSRIEVTGDLYKLAGAYEDQLACVNGEWLFTRRDYRVLVEERPA